MDDVTIDSQSARNATLDDAWLRQYCRQIALPEVDLAGQERLQNSRMLVVGAGGLGSTAALLLAGAGVGTLELIDDDDVELSNLHRQIGHTRSGLGHKKVESLEKTIHDRYPNTQIICQAQRFEYASATADSALASVKAADVILDCTDNFSARYALNHACWLSKKPLVSAAAIRLEGQLTTFNAQDPHSPCYACLYPPVAEQPNEHNCLSQGVFGPIPSVLASLQALEACRVLLGIGETMIGRLLLFDAISFRFRTLQFAADPACVVCGQSV